MVGRSVGCLSVYLIVIVGVVYVQRATTRNPPQSVARSSKRKLSSGATSSCCNSSARAWRFYVYVRVSFVYFCAREKLRSYVVLLVVVDDFSSGFFVLTRRLGMPKSRRVVTRFYHFCMKNARNGDNEDKTVSGNDFIPERLEGIWREKIIFL